MTIRWLRCKVRKGMFARERTIEIQLPDGQFMSAFVPETEVEEVAEAGGGRVRVRCVSAADGCWVLLPAENPNPVSVREADLVG